MRCLLVTDGGGWADLLPDLVQSRKLGRTRTCSLNAESLRSAERWISERRTFVERRLDRLGEYLADTADQPGSGHTGPAAPHAPA
jgi:hypothetical protein